MRCWLISLLTDEGERPSNLAIDAPIDRAL